MVGAMSTNRAYSIWVLGLIPFPAAINTPRISEREGKYPEAARPADTFNLSVTFFPVACSEIMNPGAASRNNAARGSAPSLAASFLEMTRQSGLPDLRVATLGDLVLMRETREAAKVLVARDPDFSIPEDRLLGERVARLLRSATDPV